MKTAALDYRLPSSLIALHPTRVRRHCRLLVLDRVTGAVSHHRFDDLPTLLRRGDLLVINDTAVIPARLVGNKQLTGGKAEVFLLERLGERRWRALVRPGARMAAGTIVSFGRLEEAPPHFVARIGERAAEGARIVEFEGRGNFDRWLSKVGRVPLPPYIARDPEPRDREDYQTVFAREAGAVAAPTAGLHFDRALLDRVRSHGVGIAPITLHVGAGTFRPIRSENLEDHVLESERYVVSGLTQRRVWARMNSGRGRVIAVGTTVTRTLETLARDRDSLGQPRQADRPAAFRPLSGESALYIMPGYRFRAVDGLITNFHLPKSSLLALVAAFAGLEPVLNAYHIAVREKYRFYSYGDAMLIL